MAGEVADQVVVDSIEYSIGHFNLSLIVVLGHLHCGALIGALHHLKLNNGAIDLPSAGHINAVLIPIEIAIVEAGIDIYAPDALELAIQANISYVANQPLVQSPIITAHVNNKKLSIIGAEYDLLTGVVKELFIIQ